jgi:hypothetical protein
MHVMRTRVCIVLGSGLLTLAGCGGGATGGNNNGNGNGNDNTSAALAACERYLDHLEGLTCRDPGIPPTTCIGVEQLPAEEVPNYDCLIDNLFCTPEGELDDSGTAECF